VYCFSLNEQLRLAECKQLVLMDIQHIAGEFTRDTNLFYWDASTGLYGDFFSTFDESLCLKLLRSGD
jgi:hypothetical protein